MAKVISICNQKGGVGKCLAPETPIFLSSGEIISIEQLFNKNYDASPKKYYKQSGLFIEPKNKIEVFSLNQNLKIVKSKVNWLYRGKTNKLYKIKSNKGKIIKTTPEHPFLVLRDDKLNWIKAKNLKIGDFIAAPRQINFTSSPQKINLIPYLSEEIFVLIKNKRFIKNHLKEILLHSCDNDIKNKILLRILEDKKTTATNLYKIKNRTCIFTNLKQLLTIGLIERKRLTTGKEYIYFLKKKNLIDYLFEHGFSIKAFRQLNLPIATIKSLVYRNKSFHRSLAIKPIFYLDEKLAKFLATVLAEGRIEPSRIVLWNSSKQIIEDFISFCQKLGLPYKKKRLPGQWMVSILKAGTLVKILTDVFEIPVREPLKSSQIKIPNKILQSPDKIILAYLSAYIDGDGYIAKNRSALEITSASLENIVRFQYAFLRFGINASIYSKMNAASNSPSPKKRRYYTLVVSGAPYIKKILQIFSIKDKNKLKRLRQASQIKHNTNIDVVPVNNLLRKVRHKFDLLQKELGCQGTITDYEDGSNYLSREALMKIISRLEQNRRVNQNDPDVKMLSILSQSDLFWERVTEIKQINYKGFVYDLTIDQTHNFIAGEGAFVAHNTTTAINLSTYLAALGKRVLLIDFDPQANATSGLGLDPKNLTDSIYQGIFGYSQIENLIKPTTIFNHHLIPANQDLSGALVELVNLDEREFFLRKFINRLRHNYDYIFIDLPPSLNLLTVNGLVASDEVLIPIQCEYYSLEGLSQLLGIVDLINHNLGRQIKVAGALLTMYDKREKLSREVAFNVRKYFPHYVFETEIPRCVALAEAPSFGKPIILYHPNSTGAKAYERLAKEILEQENRN
jgi:chromosome partitioning protein